MTTQFSGELSCEKKVNRNRHCNTISSYYFANDGDDCCSYFNFVFIQKCHARPLHLLSLLSSSFVLLGYQTLLKKIQAFVLILFFIQFPSVGRRRKAPTLGLRPRYYSARNDTSDRRLEALNLPPTKVEEKRSKLQRLYERKEKKRAENLLRQAKEKEDAMGHPEPLHKVSDYEKNKLKIAKSNIQFELPTCGSLSTDRSTQPTATQRGTK